MPAALEIDRRKIADFCRRHRIRYFALFGSVLRDDFGPHSDVDVLVEFEPGKTPGFLRFFDMEEELSSLLCHRRVDLVTRKFLNHRIMQRVLDDAEVLYEQG